MDEEIIRLKVKGAYMKKLHKIVDDRGSVMHMMRNDEAHFSSFGEVYFSTVKAGIIKAWKYHKEMEQNLSVPRGKVKFILWDSREFVESFGIIEEIILSADEYSLLHIPARVWYGFKGLESPDSLICNCTTIPFSESEVVRAERIACNEAIIW